MTGNNTNSTGGTDPLTSTDPETGVWTSQNCTTSEGKCEGLLSQDQVDGCFQLAWGVCQAEYNDTHPVPLKNDTMYVSHPECTHLLFEMICNWSDSNSSRICTGLGPFCEEEYIPQPEPTAMSTYTTYTTTMTESGMPITGSPTGLEAITTATLTITGVTALPSPTHKVR
jgi:hypothetical protein